MNENDKDIIASAKDTEELLAFTGDDDVSQVADIPMNTLTNNNIGNLGKQELQILSSALDNALSSTKNEGMSKTAAFMSGDTQMPYPSPFINLSDTKIPRSTSEIFKWCKYYYMFDPLISGSVNALASFPVTEVYLEDSDAKSGKEQSDMLKFYNKIFFDTIHITKLLVEMGIDYYLYGNVIVFGEIIKDEVVGRYKWKHITRLDPTKMLIDYNPVTQEKKFRWIIPEKIAKIVKDKKPVEEYNKIPQILKDACNKKKSVLLNPNNVYHIARPSDSSGDSVVWGTPVIANVIKLLMYRTTLRQAQEAIAREHIVPMRLFYLQKSDSFDPTANWSAVAQNLANELKKAVRDPNYKVVSPVPVGLQNVGGEGRALLLTNEIEQVQNEILAGMNVPREFIFGGVSYSGSSIALKILENNFITYRLQLEDFMNNFIIKTLAVLNGEYSEFSDDSEIVTARMTDMKMQDDVQQKQIVLDLNARGKVSDEYVWKMMGLDVDKIKTAIKAEAVAKINDDFELQKLQSEKQFELQKIQMQQQAELQKMQNALMGQDPQMQQQMQMEQPQQGVPQNLQQEGEVQGQPQPQQNEPPQEEGSEQEQIMQAAKQLMSLPKRQQEQMLSKLPQQMQQQIALAMQQIEAQPKEGVDMRPMPEQKPPRRKSLA